MNELNKKFQKLIIQLQDINKKSIYDFDMPQKDMDKINVIGQKIKDEGLLELNENIYWAKQLLMKNNVHEKYWGHVKYK